MNTRTRLNTWRVAALLMVFALCVLAGCGGGSHGEEATRDNAGASQAAASPVDKLIDGMTLKQKICQLLVVDPETLTGYGQVTQTGDATKAALDAYPVGGIIYFAQNLQTMDQTREMLAGVNDYMEETGGIPLFLSIDEEGGTVAHCADVLGTTTLLPMYEYRDQGTDVARQNARAIATDLVDLGFNLDFAPVADTWSNPLNEVIGVRAYSDDFEQAAELVAAAVKGFHEGGIACSVKHFPGHGNTSSDSHDGSVYSDDDLENLRAEELLPFASGIDAGADMVMVGHITMTSIDPSVPASLSAKVVDGLLRDQMGYDGVVITDAMNMGAIVNEYGTGESAVRAIEAGVDIVLMPVSVSEAVDAISKAVDSGRIDEARIDQSVRRVLELKVDRGLLEG